MVVQGRTPEREFVSVDEAEAMTGISRWTWRRRCYEGSTASSKVGRRLLIPVSEVRRIMSEGMRPAQRLQGRVAS
jgi:hypothetical protein